MGRKPERKFYLKEFKAISHAISIYEDLALLMNHLSEGTSRTFEAKGCSIFLVDDRENQLVHVSTYGISEEYLNKGPLVLNKESCVTCTGEPVLIRDMQKDVRVQYPESAAKEGIVSMLSVPIKYHGAVIGVIRVYHAEPWEYHEADIETLCVLAEQLGVVIENNGLKNFLERVKMALESLPLRALEGL
ncbi:GAF domain protein [uncultured Desulfatiglans sp.]|uniref:GAF domain protein n=1 Tax=Uncultured Desulfatiglans sp. TaxID=1748965 RepID=A0A653A5C0_UNCDX|nr:GAF domain protein [uncultured Desulfatiglans sp.]